MGLYLYIKNLQNQSRVSCIYIFLQTKNFMKNIFLYIFFITTFFTQLSGQNIIGQWHGILKVPGQSLRLSLHIHKNDSGYTAALFSLDQSGVEMPVTEITFDNSKLKFNIKKNDIKYFGTLNNDTIQGLFQQSGATFPLFFQREEWQRPQEPKKPYPYYEDEVWFTNPVTPEITLAGTLTLPKLEGIFPAVILVSGSGAQNRDSEVFGHKIFLVISDYLTRNGFAVLRYDDRGTAASTGIHDTCSTYDFSLDAEAAFKYLQNRKEINSKQIGFIGHSEGGMIASLVAARNKEVASIILLAAPGIKGDSLLLLQAKIEAKSVYGSNEKELERVLNNRRRQDSIILYTADAKQMEMLLTDFFKTIIEKESSKTTTQEEKDEIVKQFVKTATGKYYQYLLKYDPALALAHVQCPVLALNGENDVQVPADENLNAIQTVLLKAENADVTVKKIPKLNHLFQTSETGSVSEYALIKETFSQEVLEILLHWLNVKYKL